MIPAPAPPSAPPLEKTEHCSPGCSFHCKVSSCRHAPCSLHPRTHTIPTPFAPPLNHVGAYALAKPLPYTHTPRPTTHVASVWAV